jgi:putative spermidine/putrescine transport system substrate-binding protein
MAVDLRRRDFLDRASRISLGAMLGLPGLISSVLPAIADPSVLKITHFGGPYQILGDIIAKPYDQATHEKITYDVEISPSAVAKIQTQKSDPPFDVVMLSRAWGLRALRTGLLMRIAASEFPEAAHVLPDIVPAGGWGVGTILDTIDLMVDTNQIKAPVTSWLDLWRGDMKGKIMLPAAVNGATAMGFFVCLVRAIGGDIKSEAAVNEAFARLKALKPAVRSFFSDGAQPNLLIERGDIAVAPQFGIRIVNTTLKIPSIIKATPKEGVLAVPYDLCIPVNCRNAMAAKAYINFTLTKPIQESMVTKLLATPVRDDVAIPASIAPLVKSDRIFFQDEEYAAMKQREWLDRYTREVQA